MARVGTEQGAGTEAVSSFSTGGVGEQQRSEGQQSHLLCIGERWFCGGEGKGGKFVVCPILAVLSRP